MAAPRQVDCGISRRHNPLGLSRPSRSAPVSSIIDLRKLLAERFPHSPPAPPAKLPTGCELLDQVLKGGLPKSGLTELISPRPSSGSASLIHRLIRGSEASHQFVVLIDGCDSFDPQSFGPSSLLHLLWVRCHNSLETMKAADLLLRDGNFSLVIVDLVLNPLEELRKIPQTTWYRLQRLVETNSTACLVLTRRSLVSSAEVKIVLENSWTLRSFDDEKAIEQLRFRMQRSHLKSELGGTRSVASDK